MKRRAFIGMTSALLACVTKVVFARSVADKPDVLVFKVENQNDLRLDAYKMVAFRKQLSELAIETGHKVVLVGPEIEPYIVGKSTFVSWAVCRPLGKFCIVRCRATGEEIPRVRWAESTSGLVCHYLDGKTAPLVLSQFPDGIEFVWQDVNST